MRHEGIRRRGRRSIRAMMNRFNRFFREDVFLLAGFGLNFGGIAQGFWREVKFRLSQQLAPIIRDIFASVWERMKQSFRIRVLSDVIRDTEAAEYSVRQSDVFSGQYVDTTLENLLKSDSTIIANRMFDVARANRVAVTEVNRVIVASEFRFVTTTNGLGFTRLEPVWKHHDLQSSRPPRHANAPVDPCPVCSPLEGLRFTELPQQFISGPPAHPNCDCHLEWEQVESNVPAQIAN